MLNYTEFPFACLSSKFANISFNPKIKCVLVLCILYANDVKNNGLGFTQITEIFSKKTFVPKIRFLKHGSGSQCKQSLDRLQSVFADNAEDYTIQRRQVTQANRQNCKNNNIHCLFYRYFI